MILFHKRPEGTPYKVGFNFACSHWINAPHHEQYVNWDKYHTNGVNRRFWFAIVLVWNKRKGGSRKFGFRFRTRLRPYFIPYNETNDHCTFKWR